MVSHLTHGVDQLIAAWLTALGGMGNHLTKSRAQMLAEIRNDYGGSLSHLTTGEAQLLASIDTAAGGSGNALTESATKGLAGILSSLGGSGNELTLTLEQLLAAISIAVPGGGGQGGEGGVPRQAVILGNFYPLYVNQNSSLEYATPAGYINEYPLQDLLVEELFGVSHPDQLITFPNAALNSSNYKLMEGAQEVAYQADGTDLLVRLEGGVAANATRTFAIAEGARSAASQVSVTDQGTYWLMDNGIVACRIAKATETFGTPSWVDANTTELRAPDAGWPLPNIPAPIQGVRHYDGTWTGHASQNNLLYSGVIRTTPSNTNRGSGPHPYPALTMTVTILENGPLRAKVQVSYTGPRPDFVGGPGGSITFDGHETAGFFTSTITLEAGQRTIKVDDNSDVVPYYKIPMGPRLDRCRMLAHVCNNADYGHLAGGGVYTAPETRTQAPGDWDFEAEWNVADVNQDVGAIRSATEYPPLENWYSFTTNGGLYYYFFNSAGATGDCWGIIQGGASEIEAGSEHNVLAGLYTDGAGNMGISRQHRVFGPTSTGQLRRRLPYFIFLGRKEDDISDATQAMPSGVSRAFNLTSGTAQLWKQVNNSLEFPDPTEGWSSLYLSQAETEAKILAIRNDPQGSGGSGPYGRAYQDDTQYRDLWDSFRDATNATADGLVDDLHTEMSGYVDMFVNTHFYRYLTIGYWHFSAEAQQIAVKATALLALDTVDPYLTAAKKAKLKATLALCGHIIWDNDFTPATSDYIPSFSFGTANMPGQYAGHLYMFGAILKTHPQFIDRFDLVIDGAVGLLNTFVNAAGAPKESPHYTGTLTPATDLLRQLQVSGVYDAFDSGSTEYAKLVLFAEFCMQLATPPQSRFGNRRKIVSFGDSSSEGVDYYLTLIMGFQTSNLTLAKRMMDVWDDMDRPLVSFYGSSAMKIDENVAMQNAALADADFAGYMTVMRSDYGNANESAVFVCHGDWYTDHANFERGAAAIYLLGDPISIIFGSFGTPHIDNPYSWNSYVATSELGGTWNTITDIDITCGDWSDLYSDTYTWTAHATTPSVAMTFTHDNTETWDRNVKFYRDDTTMPIVRIRDDTTYAGDHVFSLPIMASGAYTKPDGSTATPTTLEGTSYAISNGACFKFTGQWGTSVDVYYFGPAADAFVGIYSHSWHPATEEAEYTAAVGGSFAETQYMLRIKTAGPCDIAIVPYPTGSRPTNLAVTQGASKLVVTATSPSINRDLPD